MEDEGDCKGWERGRPVREDGFPGVDMEDEVVDVVLPRPGVLPTSRECGAKGDGFFDKREEGRAEPLYLWEEYLVGNDFDVCGFLNGF